jgi:hypothetical protein
MHDDPPDPEFVEERGEESGALIRARGTAAKGRRPSGAREVWSDDGTPRRQWLYHVEPRPGAGPMG